MFSPSQQSLLRAIGRSGPLSRSQLAGSIGLSKAAVTDIARGLLDRGMLRAVETVYGAGRPSIRLGIDPGGAYFVGCSIEQPRAPVVLTDFAGEVVASAAIRAGRSPRTIGQRLAAALPGLLASAGVSRRQVGGCGLALSGYIDGDGGRCVRSTLLRWVDVPAAALIGAELGLPVTIENDANALASQELLFGAARAATSFSLLALGDGIGGAHVLDGRLFRGHRGGAGEIAHLTVEPGGLPCSCGKRGCVDTVASLRAIAAAAAGLAAQDPAGLQRLADAGDDRAAAVLRRAGSTLGLVLAHLVQMLDPELIVLVHPPQALGAVMADALHAALADNVLPQVQGRTPVLLRPATPASLARAAASIAAQAFMSPQSSRQLMERS